MRVFDYSEDCLFLSKLGNGAGPTPLADPVFATDADGHPRHGCLGIAKSQSVLKIGKVRMKIRKSYANFRPP